jgi:hypothetical protein
MLVREDFDVNYEKKMIYLSYMENEKRVSSGGFAKLERKGDVFFLDMQVNLKGYDYEGKFEIIAIGNEHSALLGTVNLAAGIGKFKRDYTSLAIENSNQRMVYQDICDIKISLKDKAYLIGIIKDKKELEKAVVSTEQFTEEVDGKTWQYTAVPEAEVDESQEVEAVGEEVKIEDRNENFEEAPADSEESSIDGEELNAASSQITAEQEPTGVNAPTFAQTYKEDVRQILHDMRMTPDKWQQLLKNYKQVNPYNDERVYLSLEPKDFVIMSAEYQHLAHNSFLLHGFYNYRHIILGKENDILYLGVPGVFYEREKMVAKMFGFEAFECEGGNAENGKFGYYLKKVKI